MDSKINLSNFFILLIEDGLFKNNIKTLVSTEGKLIVCNNQDIAISFMGENTFSYVRVVIYHSKVESFLKQINDLDLIKRHGISISVLIVIDKEIQKEKLSRIVLPLLPCSKQCSMCTIAKIKCLQFGLNERAVIEFCNVPDQKIFYIKRVLNVYNQIPEDHYNTIKSVTSSPFLSWINFNLPGGDVNLPFNDPQPMNDLYIFPIKYSRYICPIYFNSLMIHKKHVLDKLSVKILSIIRYGKLYNVQNDEISDWLSHLYIGEACWSRSSANRHFIRCILNYPRLFHLINKTLDDNDENGLVYIRYFLLEFINILYSKQLPFYTGKLFKSLNIQSHVVEILKAMIGKYVYFNSLIIASKKEIMNTDNNVTFEILTVSSENNRYNEYNTNIDLISFNIDEVLIPMMTIFKIESINEEYETYTITLIEQIDNPYLKSLKTYINFFNL